MDIELMQIESALAGFESFFYKLCQQMVGENGITQEQVQLLTGYMTVAKISYIAQLQVERITEGLQNNEPESGE